MDDYTSLVVGIGLRRINQNQTQPDSPQEKHIAFVLYSQNQEEKPNRIKTLGTFLIKEKSSSRSSTNKIRRKVSDNFSGSFAQILTQPIFTQELRET
jgi:hypothetical protein